MFKYERTLIKRGFLATKTAIGKAAGFVSSQITDPAVRRALFLGCAAYLLRKLPFLDQSTAEGLSDKALVLAGLLLSKLPGTAELAAAKSAPPAIATEPELAAAPVPPAPPRATVPPPAPSIILTPARAAVDEPEEAGVTT